MWIKVTDQLPECNKKYGVTVLVYRRYKPLGAARYITYIGTAQFGNGKFYPYAVGFNEEPYNSQVTHWQHLPKAPKVEK